MVTLKTLVEAQQVIDRLLAMHLEEILQHKDYVRKLNASANDRKLAYSVSEELRWATKRLLSQEVKIHD
jgi:hypothetical protein